MTGNSDAAAVEKSTMNPAVRRTTSSWLLPVALVFPLAAILVFLQQGQAAWDLQLGDSDNYMRLVQVRDLLAGQGWYDLTQHRVNPPYGLQTHWSRLADLPYAVAITLLGTMLAPEVAERLAVVAVPPLLLLFTMAVTARLADRLGGWPASVCACLLLAVSTPILAQFVPGRIDHHGLQILLLVSTVCLAAGSDTLRSGIAVALVCALSLAIGLETAPYLGLVAIWTASRWVIHGDAARAQAHGLFLGLAVLTPVALAATVPAAEWTTVRPDQLSGGHLVVILAGSIATMIAMRLSGKSLRGSRIIAMSVAGLAALTAIALFPQLVSEPYSNVDPAMRRLWIERLAETRSFLDEWQQSPLHALGEMWFLGAATVSAVFLAVTSRGNERDRFILLALLAVAGTLLTLWQTRAYAAATSIAVPVVGAVLARFWTRWQGGSSVLQFASAAMLLNPIIVVAALSLADAGVRSERSAFRAAERRVDRCNRATDLAWLGQQPHGLVLNPIDQSATILARTHHDVIAAPNHRNAEANARVYRFFTSDLTTGQGYARELRADYLVFCPDAPETMKIVSFAPGGLLAQLRAGRIPAWLEEASSGQRRGLTVLRMKPGHQRRE